MLSDVIWKAFEITGSMDAYILYKDLANQQHPMPFEEFAEEIDYEPEEKARGKTK